MELRGQAWPARTREAEQRQRTERDAVLGPVSCGFRAGNFSGFVIISVNFTAGAGEGAAMGPARPCGQRCRSSPCVSVCVCRAHPCERGHVCSCHTLGFPLVTCGRCVLGGACGCRRAARPGTWRLLAWHISQDHAGVPMLGCLSPMDQAGPSSLSWINLIFLIV